MALTNDLVKWSVNVGITTPLNGSAEFTNQGDTYQSLNWTPLTLTLGSQVSSSGIADDSCLGGSSTWFYGLIHAIDDAREISSDNVKFALASFFAHLGSKPVNTVLYFTDIPSAMEEIAEVFGGIPPALFDFTAMTHNALLYAIVKGSSIIEELRKLAEANRGILFTQKTGVLVAEDWKGGGGNPVDVIIPDEAVYSADRARNRTIGPSCLRIRGRFISQLECGPQIISGTGPWEVYPLEPPVSRLICTYHTIPRAKGTVEVKGLPGNREDYRNGYVTGYNTTGVVGGDTEQPVRVVKTEKGLVRVRTESTSGSIIPSGEGQIGIQISAASQYPYQFSSPPATQQPLRGRTKRHWDHQRASQELIKLKFPEGEQQGSNFDRTPQEAEPIQIEMTVCDPDLANQFGVIIEDVDNLYASTYDELFYLAIRKFHEFKLSQKAWQVRTKYLPCLQPNQIVQFTTPDPNPIQVTGLLAAISIEYDVTGSANMILSVWSLEDVGATEYTSGNLLMYPQLCGINEIDWKTEVTGDGYVVALNNFGVVSGAVAGTARLYQPINLEVGVEHTLYAEFVVEAGNIDMSVRDSGGIVATQNISGSGAFSFDFTPTEVLNEIEFTLGSGELSYVFNPILIKTKTA